MEQEYLESVAGQETVPQANVKKKSRGMWIVAAVVLCVAIAAVLILRSPAVRYVYATLILEEGDYAEARQIFETLGDYNDTEKYLLSLDAQELKDRGEYEDALAVYETIGDFAGVQEMIRETKYRMALERIEAGERKEAKAILSELGSFRDSELLLENLTNEMAYDQAAAYMSKKNYAEAAEQFRALGEYRDAAELAAECRRLSELKAVYEEGHQQYRDGAWLEAYRTLLSISDAAYEDTAEILEEIVTMATENVRRYAEEGNRAKTLALLQLMAEIDPAEGTALRRELIAEETFEPDWSYYRFDVEKTVSCSPDTTENDYAEILLYMMTNGESELTLYSDSELTKSTMMSRFYEAGNALVEIIPGYISVYDSDIEVWKDGLRIGVSYEEGYSDQRRDEIGKIAEAFCLESLCGLAEAGLLTSSMSHKEKAELIYEWVGFYLIYDDPREIFTATEAVAEGKGVCSAYVALCHRMCNLAGVPTYGQRGGAGDEAHIWLIHLDENGNVFYGDPTWADPWDNDFTGEQERATVTDFAKAYLDRHLAGAVDEYRYSGYTDGAGLNNRRYLWSGALWSTHTADRPAEKIVAMHEWLTGRAA